MRNLLFDLPSPGLEEVKKINSRSKGKRGELELSSFLKDNGFDARRGQQFKGTKDSPDIVSDAITALGFHIECKRVEAGNLYNWLEQAEADAGDLTPIVMHRRNDKRWVAILDLEDFLLMLHSPFILTMKRKQDGKAD